MTKGFDYRYFGEEFNRELRNATAVGLKRAAILYHARCRDAVSRANVGTYRKRKRHMAADDEEGTDDTADDEESQYYTTYDNPSKPGEAPRKRTGIGQSNIVQEFNGDKKRPAVRVGVKKAGIYMAFLELGTSHIAPRPWLVATLKKHWRMIGMLAATGGKGQIK